MVQVLAMTAGLLLARYGRGRLLKITGLAMALVNSLGQLFYHLRSLFLTSGGDEYFLAFYLGIPKEWLTFSLILVYGLGTALALRQIGGWRERLKWTGAAIIGFLALGPALMVGDTAIRSQINAENPLFRPVFGFSLPVLLVDAMAAVGLWLTLQRLHSSAEPKPGKIP